jgi:hypothetical protein
MEPAVGSPVPRAVAFSSVRLCFFVIPVLATGIHVFLFVRAGNANAKKNVDTRFAGMTEKKRALSP